MSLFICPVCRKPLSVIGRSYKCENGHCFDIASEGDANLLPANKKNSKIPGDDKDMAAARSEFLSKDYYRCLKDRLCDIMGSLAADSVNILDTGCGEGYYTSHIFQYLTERGIDVHLAGTDISKVILKKAARREKRAEYAVCSSYDLPVADKSIDILLNCFSPLALSEFARVLKSGGRFVYVVPGKRHLWGLKQVLYDVPYENEEKMTPYEGFRYLSVEHAEDEIHLSSQVDIEAMFTMTPYYWKTPRAGKERLAALKELDTRIEFNIHIFEKE